MRQLLAVLIVSLTVPAAMSQSVTLDRSGFGGRPVYTYSIVARDPETGRLGVAVQSHWFAVGSLVIWAEPGVGAVATQSFIEPRYGASALDLMRADWTARQALDAIVKMDPHPEVRQVAIIDGNGNVAAHTGERCIQYAGHLVGQGFSVQANLMLNPGVPEEMASAFTQANGGLAERMLAALEAAQRHGGDLRGRQSAAMLIVGGRSTGHPLEQRIVDLHVEDHPSPLEELGRLLRLQRAYNHMNRGDLAIEAGNVDAALEEYGRAESMFPDNVEMKFWHAVSLVNAGRTGESLPLFGDVFAREPVWRELLPRLSEVGILDTSQATITRIVGEAGDHRPAR
ncbi:MAG: DUF1028 domain-containing protein [Pseudomonadota bacterium]|nr:DUF1028 domain-containing protein [Pseudomonadota bacterium]